MVNGSRRHGRGALGRQVAMRQIAGSRRCRGAASRDVAAPPADRRATRYESYKNFMPDLNNFEVRLLVSAAEAPDVAARADLDDCDVEPGEPLPEVTKAHVAAATRRLERMSFACDMDRLTLCIRCIAARLSLPLPSNAHECGNVGHKRCGGRRYDGPLRRKMEQDNWGSIDLYRSLRAVAVRDDCRGGCG